MKKLLLSVVAILSLSFATAQEETKSSNGTGIALGAKAGLNMANLNGDIEDNSMKIGFHFGAMAEIGISEKFAVQPELLFSTQGTTVDFAGTDINYNLNYLNLPVMAKYFVAEGFSIEAGPQVGFLMSAKAKADGSDDEDLKDDLKGIDFGLNFGLGYKMDNGLNFAARYNLGLSDINDLDGDDSEFKNGVIQLSVGYFFM